MVDERLLTSWRDTSAKTQIIDFVDRATDEKGGSFVAPPDRVAVFDNDGTLWSEKPIPIQLDFTLFRMAEKATPIPRCGIGSRTRRRSNTDYRWLGDAIVKHYHGDDTDLGLLMGAVETAFADMAVEAFGDEVTTWFTPSHPVLNRPYLSCGTRRWSSCCGTWNPTVSVPTSPQVVIVISCDHLLSTSTASHRSE